MQIANQEDIQIDIEADIQIDTEVDIQIDTGVDLQIGRSIDRQINRQIDRYILHTGRKIDSRQIQGQIYVYCIDRYVYRCGDRQKVIYVYKERKRESEREREKDKQIDKQIDRQLDRQLLEHMYRYRYIMLIDKDIHIEFKKLNMYIGEHIDRQQRERFILKYKELRIKDRQLVCLKIKMKIGERKDTDNMIDRKIDRKIESKIDRYGLPK